MKKRITLRTLLSAYMLVCTIILGTFSIAFKIEGTVNNGIVVLSFIINGAIIFLALLQPSNSSYRLVDMFNVFMFIFMFAAPLIQYIRGSFPWWDTNMITDQLLVYTNIVITIFILLFIVFYNTTKVNTEINHQISIKNYKATLDLFWLLTFVTGIWIIQRVGISNLFARSTNSLGIENQSVWLIVNYSIRSIPVVYMSLNVLYYQKNGYLYKKNKFILGSIIMLLTNFPTGLPRFWVGSVYIGLIVILFQRKVNPYLFRILMLMGILVVFPFISLFRNLSFSEVFSSSVNLAPITDSFLSGDFDAFSMLARSIIVVREHGISWGNQLLGSLFFFIPRIIWPSKPVGSGYTIANLLGWKFHNVSMPFIGEAYVNFGIIGIIIFAVIIGITLKKIDMKYYNNSIKESNEIYFVDIVFPFTLGFLFFILRGDLLSSWAYYIGFMFPLIILYIFNRISIR